MQTVNTSSKANATKLAFNLLANQMIEQIKSILQSLSNHLSVEQVRNRELMI